MLQKINLLCSCEKHHPAEPRLPWCQENILRASMGEQQNTTGSQGVQKVGAEVRDPGHSLMISRWDNFITAEN